MNRGNTPRGGGGGGDSLPFPMCEARGRFRRPALGGTNFITGNNILTFALLNSSPSHTVTMY